MTGTSGETLPPLTASDIQRWLADGQAMPTADELAARLRREQPAESLTGGQVALFDQQVVAWIVDAPAATQPPRLLTEDGEVLQAALSPIGTSGLFATARELAIGTALRWVYEIDGERLGGGSVEIFRSDPETRRQPGVPQGQLLPQARWHSRIFAGTHRPWSLYVPAQLSAATPAAVMVFQDGVRFYQSSIPTVFDNLIAAGAMPPTIGIFLDPGVFSDTTASNRSFEYDTLSDQYGQFLLDEILPEVGQHYRLRQDAAGRAIGGLSSGGICAFTVAWQRPDQFSKVLSHVGSFANIASGVSLRDGGHNYPFLIRKLPPKPIRVFLQAGERDLNNVHGNWWLANLQMADALKFAGYDYQLVTGPGFHSLVHGRAIMPTALRWLWR